MPADAKSIATCSIWRNPAFAFPQYPALRTSCRALTAYRELGSGSGSRLGLGRSPARAVSRHCRSHPVYRLSAPSCLCSTIHRIELSSFVESYQQSGDVGLLFDQLKALAKRTAPDALKQAAQPFRDLPEVVIPLYERIVADSPNDAQAMVVLANSYWLTGRGPDAVEQLASRAKAIDRAESRRLAPLGAGRSRICESASIVGSKSRSAFRATNSRAPRSPTTPRVWRTTKQDPVALKLAIATYEGLLAETKQTAQRLALEETLKKLRNWRP